MATCARNISRGVFEIFRFRTMKLYDFFHVRLSSTSLKLYYLSSFDTAIVFFLHQIVSEKSYNDRSTLVMIMNFDVPQY